MIRAEFTENSRKDLEEEKRELIRRLSDDSAVLSLLEGRGIPLQEISRHPYRIKKWIAETEVCRSCRSLSGCRKTRKGYAAGIIYDDGILQETVEACPYEVRRQETLRHMDSYLICDMSDEMKTVFFDRIDIASQTPAYIASMKHCVDCCTNEKGLYLYGAMGTGKTYLAACAANYHAKLKNKTAFVHYPSLCERIASTLRSGEYRSETERMSFAKMLVIDDIGAEDVTERNRNILLSILDARLQNGRMTWFTSNDDFSSLYEHFASTSSGVDQMAAMRIMERIRALAETEKITGKDRRTLSVTA